MRYQIKTKIISGILLAVFTLTPFSLASAQGGIGIGIHGSAISAVLEKTKVPVAGIGYPNTPLTNPTSVASNAAKAACDALVTTAETLNTTEAASGFLSLGIGLISADFTEATRTQALITSYSAAKTCVHNLLGTWFNNQSTSTLLQGGDLRNDIDRYTKIDADLGKRLQDLTARQSATTKDFLRAVLTKIALGVTQNLTNDVVDGLISQYKISDFSKYADTLGTQLYTMNYINDNFSGKEKEQLMIRAIAQASFDKAPERFTVAANYAQTLAEEQTGCDRSQLSIADPNFYILLAESGHTGCQPLNQLMKAEQLAGVARAQGQTAALNEINTGQGFIPVRSCGEGLAQQQAFDNDQQQIADQMEVIRKTRKIINQSGASYEEINAELAKANTELDALKSQLDTLSSQRLGEATKSICEAIESPGAFIASSIQDFLGSHLENSMALKSDNLPYTLSFLGDLATNFITDIITGSGNSDSTLLTEEGVGNLRSGTAPITFSETYNPDAPLNFDGTNVPAGTPGGGGGGGGGNGGGGGSGGGGTPTQQDVCIPEADGELVVDCGTDANNIPQVVGDIFDVKIQFPETAGEIELSSASLQIDPSDPDVGPTIQSDGDPVSFDVAGSEEQPLSEQFEVTSLFTIITVKFTPADGSQVLVASLAIALPELTNSEGPDLPNQGDGTVLGAADSNSTLRGTGNLAPKKSGITLR
ncbi:MAG: hypothetical protein IT410_04610 [Candidatus Doudnabacteria bacterium]|nr:hypothetical protein [Candidatus Doudnabacteria bacterium]